MSTNKKNSKKNTQKHPISRVVTVFMLLALLVIGLVSTTFASLVPQNVNAEEGSLITQIKTAVANREKEEIANVGANVDLASTGYDLKCVFIYDNSHTKWSSVQLLVGHNTWSEGYVMTKLTGTDLWYYNMNSTWGGATHIAIFNASGKWSGEGNSVSHRVNYMDKNSSAKALGGNMTSGIQLLTSPSNATSSTDNFTLTTTYVSSYSGLNTQTSAYVQLSENGGAYVNSNKPGTVKLSGYKFNSNTSTSSTSVSSSVDVSNNASDVFARTSKITLAATLQSGYTFDGWYNSSGTRISTNLSTTVTCGTSEATYYAKYSKITYTYSVSVNTSSGGSVSPDSGSVSAGESVTLTATPKTGYTFVNWTNATNGTIASSTSAETKFTPTATGATVKANFRPNTPSVLTLTGTNVASGTSGTGTEADPYIVFEDGGFTLTAKATVVSGASARYSTTSGGTYTTTSTFTPSVATKGTKQSYTVYAKAYAGSQYSSSYKSATAHYMVFSHLNGANTGFNISSDSITDIETVTLSGAYINDDNIAEAEKQYITQTYQISTNNSTFSDLSDTTWAPESIGTYYFRVKTTNTKTGETVYSTSKSVTVVQSTVYYDITVVNDGDIAGEVKLYANGVEIKDSKILSNSELSVSLTRPSSDYYIDYLDVDTITEFDNEKVNGDITKFLAYDHVKGNVTISYKLVEKPKVTVAKPTNAESVSFEYLVDGRTTTKSNGEYYVDYSSTIKYTVIPKTGYYVSAMTYTASGGSAEKIGTANAGAVTGTKANVTATSSSVTATLTYNKTVTVSIDKTNSDVTTGGSMTIDGVALAFGQPKPLNYGAESTIVITPPEGCYAVVSGNNVEATIDTDGKATFKVTLTGANKNYTVKFVNNPKIYMIQPRYGSIYVTDGSGNYYFNGDSVGYGTELILNVKPDHANASIEQIIVNGNNIGTVDGTTFNIYEDSTVTADIFVDSKFTFKDGTEYGTRRIFFTDNASWGDGNVSVHYSTTSGDTNLTTNSKVMTYKYTNDIDNGQKVYYADIPFNSKYVTFYNKSNTNQKTNSVAISNDNNAFWNDNGTCTAWNVNYSDYTAEDRDDTIQQGTTVKDEAVIFQYTCDYGDDTLSAKKIAGNSVDVDFSKGTLSITPTENEHSYSLVEVKSAASTTVKYYLIRVENFEIVSFSGLQKIYSSKVFNNIQLDLIVKGGVLNYAAKLFASDTNKSGTYSEITPNMVTGFEENKTLQAYTNSFLLEYKINTMSGVKYYKVEATDGANHKASKTLKTLFGTNTYDGTRCIYFYNNTDKKLTKYNVRACFKNSDSDYVWATMQPVGVTGYYRAVIPNGYSMVDFFITGKNMFTNNRADVIDSEGNLVEDFCSNAVVNVNVPDELVANMVYLVSSIDSDGGITGEFAQFDY